MQQIFYNKVELQSVGEIAYVYLRNEKKLNALDLDVLQGLVAAARAIKRDKHLRAVIMQGCGGNFSAGLDIMAVTKDSKFRLFKALFKVVKRRNLFQDCALQWRDLPLPVIALIEGHCYGGGMQIAMGADFRIAHPQAKLSIMESKWGLVPDMSGLVTFPASMRMDQAKLLSMTAEVIGAEQAQQCGLVTAVSAEPLQLAQSWVAQFTARSPDALATVKRLFHKVWHNSSERKKLFWETWLQLKLLVGKNQKIAVARELGKDKVYLPRQ